MEDEKFKHQKHYEQRMRQLGFRRVAVWVPEQDKRELQAIADDMRQEHLEKTGQSI